MRWFLMVGLAAMLTGTVLRSARAGLAGQPPSCTFSIASEPASPEIVAAPGVKERAWVMAQPDSPLAILRVDLSDTTLIVSGSAFETGGRHVVDVKNVSDRLLTDAEVWIRAGTGPRSGVGSGHKVGRALRPGEQARIDWKSGAGRGGDGAGGNVSVVALVDFVVTPGCTYKPSQAWPTPAESGTSEPPARGTTTDGVVSNPTRLQ